MPFQFTLQPVLRLRVSYERIERLRLLQIAAAMVQVQNEISAAVRESEAARQSLRERLARGSSGVEIQFEAACDAARLNYRQALDARLAVLRRKHETQKVAYRNARQKREIVETLRERQFHEYLREQARREQRVQDELYLLRHGNPLAE
ncbi:MAG: flagellar export protein FliJ [Candidatus Acidiferrales bacterium]